MRQLKALAFAFLLSFLLGGATLGTTFGAIAQDAGQEATQEPDTAPPPYQEQLLRLAEILGALHHLRPLCGASDEKTLWRDQMQALMESENAPYQRRVLMADAFNRGYDAYRSVHLRCTPSARATIESFVDEGARISGEIVARYGDDN